MIQLKANRLAAIVEICRVSCEGHNSLTSRKKVLTELLALLSQDTQRWLADTIANLVAGPKRPRTIADYP